MFFCAVSVAGAFSGLLAFAISEMNGVGGLAGWRWIFILEGIATIITAISAFFFIYDYPETASFLTEEERAFVVNKLRNQGFVSSEQASQEQQHQEKVSWRYIRQAFSDWQVYVAALLNMGIGVPLFGISLFLPTIINELGYTATHAQLLTVPIYVGAAISSVTVAYLSDRQKLRFPFVFGSLLAAFIGLIITIASSSSGAVPGLVYAGVFITVCGLYPAFPANVTWLANNVAGESKRSVAMAIHIGFGNMGGAIASNLYRTQDAPKYLLALGIDLGFVFAALLAAITLRLTYARINKRRGQAMDGEHAVENVNGLGDRALTFRYML
jgi:MFS family permease